MRLAKPAARACPPDISNLNFEFKNRLPVNSDGPVICAPGAHERHLMKTLIYAGLALCLLGSTSALAQAVYGPAQTQTGVQTGTLPQALDHRDAGNSPDAASRFSPGDRVPDDYQQDRHVVTAWQTYGLQTPPPGYRWLRDDHGGQYMLVSMSTGRIVDVADQMTANAPHDRGVAMGNGDRHDGNPSAGGQWSRGDHAPDTYRGDDRVVGDWQQRNLAQPASGYTWVRNDGGQYAQIDRHSGMVAEVVLQDRYRADYAWSRGERLSGGYLDARFTVANWRDAGLPRPAHGYHWVNINHHYMLTSRHTGVIRDIRDAGQ